MANSKSEGETTLNRSEQLQALALAAREGDAQAYRDLLTSIQRDAKRLLAFRVPNGEQVEEIVQEILLSVHRSFHTYDPARPFAAWLNAIVRFRTKDFFRSQFRMADSPTVDGAIEHFSTPSPILEDSFFELLETAMERLSAVQRKLFVLLKFEGRSVREAARELGMSESAAKVSAHRAYEKIRAELKEDEHDL